MKTDRKVLVSLLTIPLLLYAIPYAYAATVSSTYQVSTSHTIVSTDTAPLILTAACKSGDYATGGGAGHNLDSTQFSTSLSLPTQGGFTGLSGQPDGWVGFFNWPSPTSFFDGGVVTVTVICQTPITVAGIGVPEFGSLYSAIALAAVLYFGLTVLRQRRAPAIPAPK